MKKMTVWKKQDFLDDVTFTRSKLGQTQSLLSTTNDSRP